MKTIYNKARNLRQEAESGDAEAQKQNGRDDFCLKPKYEPKIYFINTEYFNALCGYCHS